MHGADQAQTGKKERYPVRSQVPGEGDEVIRKCNARRFQTGNDKCLHIGGGIKVG